MIKLISECNYFMKQCGFTYSFCGGYALELFLGKKLRPHSDIDITVFEEDRINSIEFVLSKGWNVYEHKFDWIDNMKSNSYLRSISNPHNENISELHGVWAIKPDCSFIKIEPKPGTEDIYNYEILNGEQLNFDFFEILFNKQKDGNFVFDSFTSQGKNITRELDKAILYNYEGIPYLAPEVKLLIISHPAYLTSDYHKVKNRIDFDSTAPLLPKENRDWLISALETAYPDGNTRIEQLKALNK